MNYGNIWYKNDKHLYQLVTDTRWQTSYTILNILSEIHSTTQSQWENRQFENPRWSLDGVSWIALLGIAGICGFNRLQNMDLFRSFEL